MKLLHKKIVIGVVLLLGAFFLVSHNTVYGSIEEQEQLQTELKNIEAEISKLEKELSTTKGEKKTLSNKIYQLKQEQNKIKLQIQSTTIRIKTLEEKLAITADEIKNAEDKIAELKGQLSTFIRLLYQKNHEALVFRLILQGQLSDAVVEVRNLERLSDSIGELVSEVKKLREELENKKEVYQADQEDANELLKITKIQNTALGGKLQEQSQLLKDTQGKEENYQNLIQGNKKRAAEIKSRIYELLDVGTQITFGEAVTIAEWVGGQTGVQPSLLLAILTQESNLGKNVGTCNRLGDPPEKSWKVIMKPERDQEPFKTITAELEKDPDITPVSCPMKNKDGSQLGWGGAMGPAQFIPSTWVRYKAKVSAITGKTPADPWDIRDAFLASALLLKANGADGTRNGNWKAAMRYFSGGTNPKYSFYGDNVLALADKYEEDIKALK